MTTFLIIAALIAAVYLYAAVVFHYGFKQWLPLCGGRTGACDRSDVCRL